jgi:5'-methylthioadenosine phosphorylase
MEKIDIGIIGGSGFYQLQEIENIQTINIETPFGKPTSPILCGSIHGVSVAFISRHGLGHCLNPSEVNYQANVFALKMLSVKTLISVSAVGSLKEDIKPLDLVVPDQFVDQTYNRQKTFFANGVTAHVSMAEPVCPRLAPLAVAIAREIGLTTHPNGIYLNMEGPQFSSRAESETYRKLNYSIIGMTMAVEAKLAREAEMCYLPLAFVTDYDCWHQEAEAVTVEMIIETLNKNVENSKKLLLRLIAALKTDAASSCSCRDALKFAIITQADCISDDALLKLQPLVEKYIKKPSKL